MSLTVAQRECIKSDLLDSGDTVTQGYVSGGIGEGGSGAKVEGVVALTRFSCLLEDSCLLLFAACSFVGRIATVVRPFVP